MFKLLGLLPKRVLILGLMGVAAAGVYVAAKLCAGWMVAYVVEETLIQKAPAGMDPHVLRSRLESGLAVYPDKATRLQRLMEIAQTLERVQTLTPEQLESVLTGRAGRSTGDEP